jgi:hypothetical protein
MQETEQLLVQDDGGGIGVCTAPLNAIVGSDRADHHRRQPIRDGPHA